MLRLLVAQAGAADAAVRSAFSMFWEAQISDGAWAGIGLQSNLVRACPVSEAAITVANEETGQPEPVCQVEVRNVTISDSCIAHSEDRRSGRAFSGIPTQLH